MDFTQATLSGRP